MIRYAAYNNDGQSWKKNAFGQLCNRVTQKPFKVIWRQLWVI